MVSNSDFVSPRMQKAFRQFATSLLIGLPGRGNGSGADTIFTMVASRSFCVAFNSSYEDVVGHSDQIMNNNDVLESLSSPISRWKIAIGRDEFLRSLRQLATVPG